MEVYFRREIQHNYLIIEPDDNLGWNYEVKMLMHNSVAGLLKFRMKQLDGEQQFFYEITSKQPLSRVLESRAIYAGEIRLLITELISVLNRIESFLFLPEQILLQPEYIYLEPEQFQVYFCLVPGRKADFSKELQELLYFLLQKVDHQNQESVVLAYGLYQETQKENYGIVNLMNFLSANTTQNITQYSTSKKELLEQQKKGDILEENYEEKDTYKENKDLNGVYTKQSQMDIFESKILKYVKYINFCGWIVFILGIAYVFIAVGIDSLIKWKTFLWAFFICWFCGSVCIGILEIRRNKYYFTEVSEEFDANREIKIDEEEKWSDFFKEEEKNGGERKEELEFQTTLLGKKTEENIHSLISIQEGYEDIVLSYYPFLIGKAEYMTDYVLQRPSISRMHVKIDRTEQGFQITDLNSTNGTWVGEHQLEANETFPLHLNDKVRLADLYFWFK